MLPARLSTSISPLVWTVQRKCLHDLCPEFWVCVVCCHQPQAWQVVLQLHVLLPACPCISSSSQILQQAPTFTVHMDNREASGTFVGTSMPLVTWPGLSQGPYQSLHTTQSAVAHACASMWASCTARIAAYVCISRHTAFHLVTKHQLPVSA